MARTTYTKFGTRVRTISKYGISDDPIEADRASDRIRDQLYFLNLSAGWVRYIGRIIQQDIGGRVLARKMEAEYIHIHLENHGVRPRGNPPRRKSKFDPLYPP
ncbi:MAG: hypothetical protein IPH31_11745 [Lewinellaceae bacterium]|nr:hypothetical protein [Lewinellaceae bacterium]